MLFQLTLKLTLLLLAAASYHVAFTPPRPPPAKRDGIYTGQIFERVVRGLTLISKLAVFGFIFCDFIFAVQVAYPQSILKKYAPLCPANYYKSSILPSISPVSLAALALMIFGAFLREWCHRTLGDFFTFEIMVKDSHSLITTGPYAYVRHPSYTGAFSTIAGFLLLHFAPGNWNRECKVMSRPDGLWISTYIVLALFSVVSMLKRGVVEDKMLRHSFGGSWEKYSTLVPWRFLPGIA